jgi:predicted TIM-barrel fold metal-dependent hydrolase
LKGITMINLDDIEDGFKELERAARLGLSGAMITEYPLGHRRYDQPEYEPFWAAAAALDLPLRLLTTTRRQGKIRGPGAGRAGHERAFLQLVAGRTDPGDRAGKGELNAPDDCDLTKTGS